jgi:hypothetical protein
MRHYKLFRQIAFAIAATIACSFSEGQTDEWQIHAKWCTTDRGSSHGAYINTCRTYDQFDSVIACQQDAGNGRAVQLIQAAGRSTVNTFMDNYKPKECR